MRGEFSRAGGSIEGSNVPGNPLRSYRMSMLAHGFVDDAHSDEFALDASDPMSYSVVRLRGQRPIGAVVAVFVVAILVALAIAIWA